MAFPKSHGLTLASNSWLETAVMNQVTTTPTSTLGGEISFDTNSGAEYNARLKTSTVTSGGAIAYYTIAFKEDMDTLSDAAVLLDGSQAMTGDLDMGGNQVIVSSAPTQDTHAVNKLYTDSLVSGIDWKDSARVGTTATDGNLDLATGGLLDIDGITTVAGDRVLVMNQTDASENGLYVAAAGAWARATDHDGTPASEVSGGNAVFVEEGATNADNGFTITSPTGVVDLGTDSIVFTQFSGAGQLTADHGLAKNGNEIDVVVADIIDTAKGLSSDGAGAGLAAKIGVNLATVQYAGEDNSAGNNKFSIAATNVDAALDTIVDKIDQDLTNLESQVAGSGASLVGYEGQSGANGLFDLAASTSSAALDALGTGLDAEMKSADDYEADMLAQSGGAGTGAALVGYDGATGANTLASLGASQVDAALDSLVSQLDAEMKNQDDYEAAVLNQAAGSGSALVGYDGAAGANTLFSLAASTVADALDAIVTKIDANEAGGDTFETDLADQTAGSGSALVGYDGATGANTLFSLAASQVDVALDSLVTGLDAEMKNQDDYEADVLSQAATEGSALVGYDGNTGANSLFLLSASQVDAALDSIVAGLDAEMQNQDDYETAVANQAAGSGSAMVGYDGVVGANTLASLAASQVDAALDSLVTQLDAEMQNQDDYEAAVASNVTGSGSAMVGYDGAAGANTLFSLAASSVADALDAIVAKIDAEDSEGNTFESDLADQTAGSGSALVGYDGAVGANALFTLVASQVDVALDSLVTGLDAEMQNQDDYEAAVLSQATGSGSALVGYDGITGANTLASLAASQVDAALDSLVTQLDAEMKNQDDYEAAVLSQAAAAGSAKVGYDGNAGANTLFSLAASQVDAALDSIVVGLDAEMQNQDDYEAAVLSQTAGSGGALVGYDGAAGANTLFSLAASSVADALDAIVTKIDANEAGGDSFETDLADQTAGSGSALVGYDGHTGTNTLATLSASQVDAALDSLVDQLDAEMKSTDDWNTALAAQAGGAGTGAALVGYDGAVGANTLASLAASQVDAALDSLVTQLDAEMKNQDDYEASLLSTTATEGSALVGYDGQASTNGQHSLASGQVDAALDSLLDAIDSEAQNIDNLVTNINALNYTTTTSSAATSHTITHNLGSDMVTYSIFVDNAGSWDADIVQVSKTSNNVLTVTLTESKNIKVAVTAVADVDLT